MNGFRQLIYRIGVFGILVFGGIAPASVWAQRAPFAIPDPDPEIERMSFLVADGFDVNLFAADPLIAKPIQMNFDAAGRLWIASSEVYPQIKPGEVANDKVLVVEDSDGDGRADKTSVFAGGLLIPTGIEPGDGGAYVANSTELLHLKDTDGDGKADQTRVVLSGFGTEDTHHILHTLRWGHDGMLYFNQSIYIHSHIETPLGVRRLGAGGIWQFRPEAMELDVFIRGLWNPWGYHVDRWGQSFATDGAGGEGINYCIPGASYAMASGADRIVKGLNPGSPKYCGLEVVSGRHLPESWQGNLLTNDFRGNRVCRFVLSDDGSGFAARQQSELIKTKHVAFRPIDIKMGPDGAIYIADWYNPIIQHGEVDFRDSRRDHTRGRIWRVTAKGRPLVPRPKLVGATTEALLESLRVPEDWTRHHAKRVLKERGRAEVLPKLAKWVQGLDSGDPMFEHNRLEALWTYQTLDTPEPRLLQATLQSKDPRVKAAAARIVPAWNARLPEPLSLLAGCVNDENPRVRLEAVRALARIPSLRSAELALAALDQPVDSFLDYGLWLSARQLAPLWLPEVQAGRFDFGGRPARLVFALQAIGAPGIVKPLLSLLNEGKVPRERDESVQTLIATLGDPSELAVVLDLVAGGQSLDGPRRATLLNALVGAAYQRKVVPAGDLTRIGALFDASDEPVRAAAIRAAGAWKITAFQARVIELARAKDTSRLIREAAIEALVEQKSDDARQVVEDVSKNGPTSEVQALALSALWELDPKAAASRVVAWLQRLDGDQANAVPIVLDRVIARRGAPALLVSALDRATAPIAADLATICIRQVRASGRDETKLIDAFGKAGRLGALPRNLNEREMTQLLADVARKGDPARGEAIFRRKDLTCLKCHAVAGAGGQLGPGLESIGASAQVDYLVDSILQPGKAVKENYHAIVVATADGKVYTGIKLRQTDSELILRNAEDREVAIPLSSIEEQGAAGSIMPVGLVDGLTRPELTDLVRFLSELGKIGPFSVGTDRAFRSWRVLGIWPVHDTSDARSSSQLADVAVVFQNDAALTWQPVYTTVAGLIPLAELKENRLKGAPTPIALARTQIEVTSPGKVKIGFNSTESLTIWIDRRRVALAAVSSPAIILDLARGVHTMTLVVDLDHRREGIRCVLLDMPDSPARAQVVLGK